MLRRALGLEGAESRPVFLSGSLPLCGRSEVCSRDARPARADVSMLRIVPPPLRCSPCCFFSHTQIDLRATQIGLRATQVDPRGTLIGLRATQVDPRATQIDLRATQIGHRATQIYLRTPQGLSD